MSKTDTMRLSELWYRLEQYLLDLENEADANSGFNSRKRYYFEYRANHFKVWLAMTRREIEQIQYEEVR